MQQANLFLSNSLRWLRANSIKSIFLSLFTLLGLVTTAQCTYQVELQDTWGDGWNGNRIDIKVGTVTTNYTLGSGLDSTINLVVNTGDSIVLNYLGGGGFNSEVSFELFDPSGNSVYFSGTGPATGVAYANTAICASCLSPINLGASNILTTSADLSWTEQNAATSWHLEVTTAGSGLGSGVRAVVSANPYTASGLTAGTAYDYYVKSICTPGTDSSTWAGPFSFTTNVPAITTYPYFEGFETAVPPAGWSTNIVQGSDDWTQATANQNASITPYAGSNMAFYYSGNYSGNSSRLITPDFDLTSLIQPQLEVWHTQVDWGGDQDTIGIYYRTSPSGTWTLLASASSSITSWSQVITSLPSPSASYALMFEAYSGYGRGVTLDNFEIKETPNCAAPSAPLATNLTATTADLDWTENGTATQWQIEYDTTGFVQGTGNLVSANAKPFTLSSLTAATNYDYYVRAICGPNDTSSWSALGNFSTSFNAPNGVNCTSGGNGSFVFSDDMETGTGWTGDIGTGNGQWDFPTASPGGNSSGTGPSGPASGTTFAEYEASGFNTSTIASLVTPAIDLSSGADEAELSFYMHAFGADIGTLNVGVATSPAGPFTNLFSWSGQFQAAATDPWAHIAVDLTAYLGQTVYVEFSYGAAGTGFEGDLAIDLVQVETCVACAAPSSLAATNIASTSADLSWVENGTATTWIIEYGPTGYTPGSGTRDTVTANPYSLSGLMSNTSYDWYVQSACGPNDSSAFFGPNSFTTPCAPFVAPYTESFDNTSLPNCWSQTATTGGPWVFGNPGIGWNTSGCSVTPSDHTANGGNIASMDHSGTDAGVILQMADVDVSGLTTPYLDFYHFMCATGYSPANETYVEAFDGTSWSQVALINIGTAAWENYGFDLSSFVFNTNIVRLRFRTESGGSGTDFYGDIALDDISIIEAPSCINPASPLSANLTSSSADLSWTNPNTSTAYVIEYGAPGFTLGAGTQITGTGTSTTLSGLMSNTTYDWYVQSVCTPGSDSSAFVGPASFTTPCTAFTTPYFNDFETDALDAPPSCWLEYNTYNPSAFVEVENFTGTAAPFAGSQALYIYSWFGFTQGTDTLAAISPQFSDLSAGDKQVRFQGNSDDPTTTLIIGTVSSPSPTATFNPVDTIVFAVADTYQEVIVPFTTVNGYNGTDEYIVFAHDLNNTFDYIRIDDFNYEQIPSCPRPASLSSTPLSSSSASLNWVENGSATTWIVEYGASGFTQGSGTRDTVTSNPYTLTGLMANTTYDWYVQSACGLNDSSAFQGPGSFTTPCNAIAAPFTESFATNALPSCWNESSVSPGDSWEFGTGVDFGSSSTRPDAFGNTGEYANVDFSDDPDTTAIITPIVDIAGLTNPRLTFYYNSQTTSTSFSPFNRLIVDYWNGSSWVNVTVIDTLTTAGWTKYEFSAAGYAFNTNFVQFRFAAQEGGAAIGGTGTTTFDQDLMLDEVHIFDSVPPLPYYPIGTINTEDATTGVADSINVECATSGTVIGFDRRGGGYEFAVVDLSSGSQEGITVFDFSDLPNYTTPTAGDSIMLYGEVDQFRGLTQFRPDSIVVLKTNATLPTPLVSTNLDETTESKWLSFPDKYVLLSASQGGSFNIDMVSVLNPTDTIRMRIDSDSDIDDSLAISTNAWAAGDTICGMIGVGGQFDFNSPFLDSYQVFPNSWSDITICRNTPKTPIALPITWDDGATVDLTTIDFGGNVSALVADPTNASNTVLQSIKSANAQTWGGTTFGDSLASAIPFSAGNTTIRAVVYSPTVGTPVRLKVEDYNNPAISVETEVLTTVANGWDTLNFDMSMNAANTPAINFANTYNKMSIFYNFGTSPTAAETYYVDYVEFGNPPMVPVQYPYYPIATINTEDPTTGVADSLNVECATSGTVIGFDRRGGGYEFAVVDLSSGSQEGITVFDFSDLPNYTTPSAGDSIMLYGEVDQFRGLTQFRPDSIVVLKPNATLPAPLVSTNLDETTESKWLSFPDKYVLLSASQGGSFNIDMVSVLNPADTVRMRIDSDSDIDDSLAISTNTWSAGDTICGMIGVGGQFDFNSPFLDSYQVFPNSWSDIAICRNTVGIDEAKVEEFGGLSIYPNPTNGEFTIQTSGLKAPNALLQVRDVSGRVVLEDNIAQSNQAFTRNYNLNDPAKGLYFITLIDGDEQKTFKLIVQ